MDNIIKSTSSPLYNFLNRSQSKLMQFLPQKDTNIKKQSLQRQHELQLNIDYKNYEKICEFPYGIENNPELVITIQQLDQIEKQILEKRQQEKKRIDDIEKKKKEQQQANKQREQEEVKAKQETKQVQKKGGDQGNEKIQENQKNQSGDSGDPQKK